MIENRYFIVDLTVENMLVLKDSIVGNLQDQRASIDKALVVIKLKAGDENNYPILQNYVEYTYEEILIELQKPEWSDQL